MRLLQSPPAKKIENHLNYRDVSINLIINGYCVINRLEQSLRFNPLRKCCLFLFIFI